jgi:y4mF family transcriptional regulator
MTKDSIAEQSQSATELALQAARSISARSGAAVASALSAGSNASTSAPPGASNALMEPLSKHSNALASLPPATATALTDALSGNPNLLASLHRNLTPIRNTNHFGALVRLARQKQGLSQQHLADAAGVGRRFLSEVESGKSTLEFGKVLQVAAAAGIDLLARLR